MTIKCRRIPWPLPRFSLRLLLVVLTALSMFVALHRERLRDRVEVAWAHFQELFTAEGQDTRANHITITGPRILGTPAALDPPSPAEITAALQKRGYLGKNLRMVMEPIVNYLDPPPSATTSAQLHHHHYKCMIYSDAGMRTIYLDHNHWCIP